MSKNVLSAVFVVLLVLSSQASQAATLDAKENETLKELLSENKNLSVQLAKARKVHADIAKSEVEVSGAQQALKTATNDARRTYSGVLQDVRRRNEQMANAGCPWGGSSEDKGFVSACNAEGARLNKWLEELREKGASIEEYARKLDERQRQLSKETLVLAAKKKSNNEDLNVLEVRSADWQRRYNAFVFHSTTYERLKKITAPGASICEQMSGDASDEALRRAADCLQRLWDGVR
jgi:hypothetical protein